MNEPIITYGYIFFFVMSAGSRQPTYRPLTTKLLRIWTAIRVFPPVTWRKLPCWCLHLVVVAELEYPNSPESYAAGSVATGRVTLGGQVEG
jgi:hypothetical protein